MSVHVIAVGNYTALHTCFLRVLSCFLEWSYVLVSLIVFWKLTSHHITDLTGRILLSSYKNHLFSLEYVIQILASFEQIMCKYWTVTNPVAWAQSYSCVAYICHQVVTIQGSTITEFDKQASNGVIHVIEKVMLPPQGDIVDIVGLTSDVSTLLSLVQQAGIANALKGNGCLIPIHIPIISHSIFIKWCFFYGRMILTVI